MYDIQSNILTKTGYSAGQLQAAAKAMRADNGFNDFQAFVDAENQYSLNSLWSLAHAAVESAWATSYYATARNNLFGFNAVDSDPDEASSYASQRVSIIDYADFLSKYYLKPGEVYFNGDTAHGIFVKYSSSHDSEANTVVGIMNQLQSHITGQPAPAPAPAPSPAPSGAYTVVAGDNMSNIAATHGLSLGQLEQLNPGAGHPAGNYGDIWPGDKLVINGTPTPVSNPSYHTVVKGDTLSNIAATHGQSLATIEQLNPNAGHPARNFGDIWPGDQIRVR